MMTSSSKPRQLLLMAPFISGAQKILWSQISYSCVLKSYHEGSFRFKSTLFWETEFSFSTRLTEVPGDNYPPSAAMPLPNSVLLVIVVCASIMFQRKIRMILGVTHLYLAISGSLACLRLLSLLFQLSISQSSLICSSLSLLSSIAPRQLLLLAKELMLFSTTARKGALTTF